MAAVTFQGMPVAVSAQTVDNTYKAGTYRGEAVGYDGGTVKVTVTLQERDGVVGIQDISTEQEKQTKSYWNKALAVTESIKANNGTDNVDAVSGATISSKAIINAVDEALSQAKEENVFDGGVGSKANPYLIASRDTFEAFGKKVSEGNDFGGKYIALKNDIDLSGEEWTPIGDTSHPFAGTFSGKGYGIMNLTIGSQDDPSNMAYAGLFGVVTNKAEFYDVTLNNVAIYTKSGKPAYAGALVANAKVVSVSTEGSVFQNCHATGTISVDTNGQAIIMAGGLLGFGNQYMTMANCGVDVSLSAVSGAKNCNVGGLVGFASVRALYTNCYALGTVMADSTSSGSNNAAGLIGGANGMIYNCYADVAVTAKQEQTKTGGLLGNGASTTVVENSYYNAEKVTSAVGSNSGSLIDITGKTSSQLNSEEFKNVLVENLTSKKQEEFTKKIEENASSLSGCDFSARMAAIDNKLYDWKISEEKVVHSNEIWVNSVIDSTIFASGDGSKENPYSIETEQQFRDFALSLTEKIDYENLYIELGNDIHLTKEWIAVGEGEYAFNGYFDGKNHSITGLFIGTKEQPYKDGTGENARMYFGLFGVLERKAEVRNLKINASIYVTSPQTIYVSAVAGYVNQALVDNVQVTGELQGITTHTSANIFVGGIGGCMYKQKIINCTWDGTARAEAVGGIAEAGGIAGLNNRGLIANCHSAGTITGTADRVAEGAPSLGGIASVNAGTIVNCYSMAEIIADCYTGYCGALVGWATGIADTFQSYYCLSTTMVTDDKTKNRLEINPAVACGWSVGPGINDEGEPYTGSASLFVEGLSKADMESEVLAEKLNGNFAKLSVDLEKGGRQSGHWSGSEALASSMRQWKVENNQVVLNEETAEATYDKETAEYLEALLPVVTHQYNEGTFYGRNKEKDLVVKIVVNAEGNVTEIQVLEGNEAAYTADIAKALENQSTEGLADSGFKSALEVALKKAEDNNTTTYGNANNSIFAGGDGSKENPWQIATEEQLIAFASYVNEDENYKNKYVVLTNDITLTKEWIPAGSVAPYEFAGEFDGNGKKITNVVIGSAEHPYTGKYAGLFAHVKNGVVKNLVIEKADITIANTGSDRIYAGAVAAAFEGTGGVGYLDNLQVTGKISIHSNSGACYAGGITGQAMRGTITNCGANVEISATSDASWAYAGGITGVNARNGLLNNYAKGTVSANGPLNKIAIGGIVGFHAGASYNNYANVELISANSTGDIGAIAGRNTGVGYMTNCYYNKDALQRNAGADIANVKAVGTMVAGETEGMGTVNNQVGITEADSKELVSILNNNRSANEGLDIVLNLLSNTWNSSLSDKISLFGWKEVAGAVICQAGAGEEIITPVEPTVTPEAPAEPTVTPEAPAEPTVTPEAPAEPTVTPEAPAEPTATSEAPAEPTATPAVPVAPTVTPVIPTEPVAATTVPESSSVSQTPKTTEKQVKKNDSIKVGSATYKVTSVSSKNPTVSYQAPKSKTAKTVVIPASIKYKGVTYKVTAISDKACYGMKNLTKVTIGSSVKTIGKKAFMNCKKLKSITIGKNVTTIKTNAFYGCKNLKTITIKSKVLKTVGKNAIKGIYKKAVFQSPEKQVNKYKKLFKKSTGYVKTMTIKK